jgi:hypothetical protein
MNCKVKEKLEIAMFDQMEQRLFPAKKTPFMFRVGEGKW